LPAADAKISPPGKDSSSAVNVIGGDAVGEGVRATGVSATLPRMVQDFQLEGSGGGSKDREAQRRGVIRILDDAGWMMGADSMSELEKLRFIRARRAHPPGAGERARPKAPCRRAGDRWGRLYFAASFAIARNVVGGIGEKTRFWTAFFEPRSRRTHKGEDPRAGKERKRAEEFSRFGTRPEFIGRSLGAPEL